MVQFPDGTDSYSKILMQYSMRCKGARVSTGSNRNLGCGEWDYSCNTYIEDNSKADSLLSTTNEYVIDGFSGSSFNYKETAIKDYYRNTKITTQVNSSSSLDTAQVGSGTISTDLEFLVHLEEYPLVFNIYILQQNLQRQDSPLATYGD